MSKKVLVMNNPMEESRAFPLIMKYSTPAIIALLISAIYNIVDRMFVGNYVGDIGLAALSICFPITFIVMGFALLVSAGGGTLFALNLGEKDIENSNRAFANSFLYIIGLELVVTLVLWIVGDSFLKVLGASEVVLPVAKQYYFIMLVGSVFQGLTFVFNDFTRVSGKVNLALIISASGAIVNIVLDAWFIIGLGWGVEGAALATVLGQVVSALIGFYIVFGGHTVIKIKKDYFKIQLSIIQKISKLGVSLFIAQIAFGFISLIYNVYLGKYGGDLAISVYAIISSIMTFVIMPASGLSQGLQPILGYCYGSKNYERVMEMMKVGCFISTAITTVIWALVQLFPSQLVYLFGGANNQDLMELGVTALRINFSFIPIVGFVMLCITFFQAIGHARPSILLTLIRQVLALVPFIIGLPMLIGVKGIFFAQPASDLITLLVSIWLLKKFFNQLRQMSQESLG
ncbi:MAG: MATE family efflux transporter [Turicibacter sanguinis]|jgi:MATE efflux family protein|uniref:MATE family efflux transporter n=1 Tax=Turicibacter TaxID=191303 RepID=UPI0006C6984C|nr:MULTISPECIES: MATE family efflux transporter [Turicibacter]MBP3903960.1 MATE family efflux transporter [Turicibacter sp.]MCU7196856.1 MATE family efflux transporter [Turicibacter sanguinis]MCU7201057.1 MATE family efflux transporter [Turicibacter sanguinis]MCU7211470.1 MATE family efflux transporter [Turicibacter sanguinis]MDB8437962.1 MATE family efflux transporter [Turicibacter sanguinis]